MKLSHTATYAIQALLQLAQLPPDEVRSCRELAADGGLPRRFLLQTLRRLVEHGLLISTRGVEGGYMLRRKAVSVLEIIEAVDGPVQASIPQLPDGDEHFPPQIERALEHIVTDARQKLAGVSLVALTVNPDPVSI